MSPLKALVVALGSISLTACGGMSDEDIDRGWQATQAMLIAGTATQGQALTSVDAGTDFDLPCPGGGAASFEAQAEASEDAGRVEADFSYLVSFDACVVGQVQVDGSLAYASESSAEFAQASHTFVYLGDVEWSGAVEGSCPINMIGTAAAGASSLGLSASLEFDGNICGRDADMTLGFSL